MHELTKTFFIKNKKNKKNSNNVFFLIIKKYCFEYKIKKTGNTKEKIKNTLLAKAKIQNKAK